METNLNTALGLISEEEYAHFRGMTVESVRNERAKGAGPAFVKMGKTIKYPIAGVKAFVARNTRNADAAPTMKDARRSHRSSAARV